MLDLKQFELPALMDLLAQHTSDYTRMFLEKDPGDAYDECRMNIERIQEEINLRISTLQTGKSINTPIIADHLPKDVI